MSLAAIAYVLMAFITTVAVLTAARNTAGQMESDEDKIFTTFLASVAGAFWPVVVPGLTAYKLSGWLAEVQE
jgi:hypothetical protein